MWTDTVIICYDRYYFEPRRPVTQGYTDLSTYHIWDRPESAYPAVDKGRDIEVEWRLEADWRLADWLPLHVGAELLSLGFEEKESSRL